LEGSLLKDLRLFDLAVRELTQSVVLYRLIGRETDAARAMITLSGTHYYAGEILLAIETLEHALAGLSPEANPREYTFAQLNLVLYLCETADFQRARRWLEAAEPLYRGLTDEWTRLRVIWLEARIAAGLGELEAAEHGYRSAQAGFLGLGIAYDVAMVSLDLASLYLGQHRYSEIRQLAAEMVVLFEAQGVHREALAAVLLFERAAREENLSRALLRSVAKRLESTRSKPVGEAGEAS
jgi:tetratricopeptide (TPR) repeat protein